MGTQAIQAMGHPLSDALQWHLDNGVDTPIEAAPVNRMAPPAAVAQVAQSFAEPLRPHTQQPPTGAAGGLAQQKQKGLEMAVAAGNLEELRDAIRTYDGLEVKRTATNMVFADGNPQARVMIIGEAPGADEDRQGLPFVGPAGHLLDRMFACIGLNRTAADAASSLYISNILNWRPPGNRTPTEAEIMLAMPFIERHIAMVRPQILVVAGATAAKAMLNVDQPISRLRGRFHDYTPQNPGIGEGLEPFGTPLKLFPMFHPSYLLQTPVMKGKAWADLLTLSRYLG